MHDVNHFTSKSKQGGTSGYQKPELKRWGTVEELTASGGSSCGSDARWGSGSGQGGGNNPVDGCGP